MISNVISHHLLLQTCAGNPSPGFSPQVFYQEFTGASRCVLSMSSVIPSSPEAAGEAVTDLHTASSHIFLIAAPHTLSCWHQVDNLPTESGVTFSPSPPGDSNGCCLVDAVNRLWSYALREALTACGLVGTAHHHLDPTTREQILAEACRLYYGYAPRSSGSVVLPTGFVHIHA